MFSSSAAATDAFAALFTRLKGDKNTGGLLQSVEAMQEFQKFERGGEKKRRQSWLIIVARVLLQPAITPAPLCLCLQLSYRVTR